MSKITDESYVTLATNDNYAIGALTLAHSLKKENTNRSLSVLTTSSLSDSFKNRLREVFDHVEVVHLLDSNDSLNLAVLKRPELGVTFTKLHCWRLTQFKKCVFLDADTVVLKNVDELFEREEFSAAADVGWPDCFNSGVFVYKPSLDTFSKLAAFALSFGSFDGGDQGLLNSYFNDWSVSESSRRLPFIYNMTTNVSYSYAPAYNKFKDSIKIVHFIGAQKPWYHKYNLDTRSVVGNVNLSESEHLNNWWSLFIDHVFPVLDSELKCRLKVQLVSNKREEKFENLSNQESADSQQYQHQHYDEGQQAPQYVTGQVSSDGVVVGSDKHQNLWESGQIEYTGRDSFSNIQAHLDSQLKK